MRSLATAFAPSALLALACAGAAPPAAGPSPAERAAIATAEARGRKMYELDRAAWRATDAVLGAIPEAERHEVSGWIVVPHLEGHVVRFLAKDEDGAQSSRYDVLVTLTSESITVHEPPDLLAPDEQAMARANRLAVESMTRQCTRNYNTVVFREEDGEAWLVYLLPASADADVVVLAGFDRARVSGDGRELLDFTPLSRSCVIQPSDPRAAAHMITHALDPTPIESHVFVSLAQDRPLYVGTETAMWKVEGGRIEWLEANPPAGDR